jgi:ribose 5-phosphate isomerase B
VDYPDFGRAMAEALKDGRARQGIIICGSGIGISIAANRHAHVRAALCVNGTMAHLARQHNDANVLALGSRITSLEIAKECVRQFLETPFEGGRHTRRVDKLSA